MVKETSSKFSHSSLSHVTLHMNGNAPESAKSSSSLQFNSHETNLASSIMRPTTSIKSYMKPVVKSNSLKSWTDTGMLSSNYSNLMTKKNDLENEKPSSLTVDSKSEKMQLPNSRQLNGIHKFNNSINSLSSISKWNAKEKTLNVSPNQTPTKNNENSDQALLHISRLKAQPALYRKMFGIFKDDQEVLARWSDGLYYLGTVCKVTLKKALQKLNSNSKRFSSSSPQFLQLLMISSTDENWTKTVADFEHRCFVQFEDKSMCWVHFKDLQPIINQDDYDNEETAINDDSASDMTCALCRDGTSEPPNQIVLCDKCGQGFHQLCHIPPIDTTVLKEEDVPWQCRMCVFAAVAKRGGAESVGPGAASLKLMKQSLPYDILSLTWDKGHKTNTEEIYCYCGGPGDWYLKMLQCCRCQQWFHEACIQCLDKPILYGDRFYLFVCSVCNHGDEYVKRLPMRWVDVVHLVLYNVTIAKPVTYYDFGQAVIPFFIHNWDDLQLGDLSREALTRSQLKSIVLDTLQSNKTRFKCGNESKKARMSWGLRTRSPPVPPVVSVPASGIINDELLQSLDFKHGSYLLCESPTPMKRNAPGDPENSSDSPRAMQCNDLPDKIHRTPLKHRRELSINGDDDSVSDNIFDRLNEFGRRESNVSETFSSDNQPKRRRGRPRKESFTGAKPVCLLSHRGRGRPVGAGGKFRRKDLIKNKKVSPTFDSENATVIPISELFQDLPGRSGGDSIGRDAYDKDLRRTMARYFGAEGRIACGERFNVLAKRVLSGVTSEGGEGPRVEYLIEWEGYTAQQLHESTHLR